ncbi:MAG: anti-sigma factor antagonist [Candidatus Omnitrophica bacterium]|nr:anti-sigma factor antagonist [Candidatus Omnitrophota bacterium]
MKIIENICGNDLVLSLEGDFDEVTSPQVEDRVEQALSADVPNICFDMSKVDYISSAGIRVLIIAHKKALKRGKNVKMGKMSKRVSDIIEVVGILPLFSVKGDQSQ